MNGIKHLILAALMAAAAPLAALASSNAPAQGTAASAAAADMTEGEIRKVDKDNNKLTIRHGEIKNLGMPGMTMVFQVKDPAMVEQVKVGDKIRFKVERGAGGFVVTALQPAG